MTKNKSSIVSEENKKEIFWNFINAGIAGAISFFSAIIATGNIGSKEIFLSVGIASVAALIKFKDYWDGEKGEYTSKLLNFV